jgi:hypothetical protein
MAKNKTTETTSSVTGFIDAVEDVTKRNDSFELVKLMQEQTGYEPKMWGPGIIGFGSYHYKYASGHEGDAPLAAFSPRKDTISLLRTKKNYSQNWENIKPGKAAFTSKK